VEEGAVLKDGNPLRAIGVNYFDAFIRTLHDPENRSYRKGFRTLADYGIPFVRFAAGYWPVDWGLYQEDKAEYFRRMDTVVATAEEYGIGLVPSLFWYPAAISDLVGEPRNRWGDPESETLAFMRTYTEDMILRYRESDTIWAWEFGNEYNLAADLPNAAKHRPAIVPHLGTALERSEADDITHDMVITALREFATAVRLHDKDRPISSGNSIPRSQAQHIRTRGIWGTDSRIEFAANLRDIAPSPCNLASVHLYPKSREGRFGQDKASYSEILAECEAALKKSDKALFIGEFGVSNTDEHRDADQVHREFLQMLNAIECSKIPLAALWVYDLEQQNGSWNVTEANTRKVMLEAISAATRRLRLYAKGGHRIDLNAEAWFARMLDNAANAGREGSSFNPLIHKTFPGESLYRDDFVGLNFEHIFNGKAEDKDISMFTPRTDPCTLVRHSDVSVSILHAAETSAWGIGSELKYTFVGDNAIDIEFKATPTKNKADLGYLAFMWASYMNHTRERRIHFWGKEGDREGWLSFGDDTDEGFETGTVSCHGVADLPYEEGAQTLNLIEHPTKKFIRPFYYGLVDGDGDQGTTGDIMAYIMMFDQLETIRFAMWNFIRRRNGEPDPHSPAWDWQFVIRNPEPGRTYGYKARMVYKPFKGIEDVEREYETWHGDNSRALGQDTPPWMFRAER
jgi:hypothetical protein